MPCHGMVWYRGWECWSHQESIGNCLNETLDFCDLNVIVCIFERKIINASTYNRVLSIMWCFVQQSGGGGDRAMVVAKAVIIGNPNPNIKRCCILQAFTLLSHILHLFLKWRRIDPNIWSARRTRDAWENDQLAGQNHMTISKWRAQVDLGLYSEGWKTWASPSPTSVSRLRLRPWRRSNQVSAWSSTRQSTWH